MGDSCRSWYNLKMKVDSVGSRLTSTSESEDDPDTGPRGGGAKPTGSRASA